MLKKLKHAQRDLSRKQKGSRNRDKARLTVARLHYRVACIREDCLHKVTTAITEPYGFVAVEALYVKGMMQNYHLAQALGDAAFGMFNNFLKNKLVASNGVVQPVGRFYPSSKTCSGCKQLKAELDLSECTCC